MGAHNDTQNDYSCFETGTQLGAPVSSGGTLSIDGRDRRIFVLSTGTYKLPANVPRGVQCSVLATGTVSLQNAAGVAVQTLTNGQFGTYTSLGSNNWAAIGPLPIASEITVADANEYTAQTTVEAWLNELESNQRIINIPILSGMLAAGTPLAAFADNAGAPAPGITLVNSEAVGIRWNNQATQNAPVWFHVPFPTVGFDFFTTLRPRLYVVASKVGATVGDATTFTATCFMQQVGTVHDGSSNLIPSATSAMTGNAATKTVQEVSVQLDEMTGGTIPSCLSLSITPTTGTLGTDDVIIHALRLQF